MSDIPQGQGWWQASDGRWYPPEQHPSVAPQVPPPYVPPVPPQPHAAAPPYAQPTPRKPRSGFTQGLGMGTGCLIAGVIGFVLLIGGCGVLIAIGSSTDNQEGVASGSSSQEEMDTDLVDIEIASPDSLGFVYVTVTVKNTSEKPSDYRVSLNLESPDGSTKYGDTFVWIRNVSPGQTASEDGLPISADGVTDARAVVTDFDRTEAL